MKQWLLAVNMAGFRGTIVGSALPAQTLKRLLESGQKHVAVVVRQPHGRTEIGCCAEIVGKGGRHEISKETEE